MVAGESPDWLPPGFTMKFKYKDGKRVKYFLNDATGKKYLSKKEVVRCAEEHNSLLITPQTKNADENGPSSIDKADAILEKTSDSASWLPNGWKVEERTRQSGSTKGSLYRVYTELLTGSKFYSKPAVTRYLKSIAYDDTTTKQNKSDNVTEAEKSPPQVVPITNTGRSREKRRRGNSLVMIDSIDEPVQEKAPQIISTTNSDGAHGQKERKGNSLVTINNGGEVSQDMSPEVISTSTTNTDSVHKKKKKTKAFVTVAVECTADDDLPSSWIKEIRTSKCGSRTRKDMFYTDPICSYTFRSKLDALRYLKTNDINSCVCKPLKREDEIESIMNKNPPSNPAIQKSSMQTTEPFLREESNGGESSVTKSPPGSDNKTVEREHVLYENSKKNVIARNNPKAESDVSNKEDAGIMAVDVAMSFPVADSSTRNKVGSRKSNKRRDLSVPSRSSKRLAGSEPEMQSNFNLNERSLRAAAKRSTGREVGTSPSSPLVASDIPQTSNIEPMKEAVCDAATDDVTREDANKLKVVEEPPTEGSAIPEEQSGVEASEKPLDNGQQSQASQLCYDFGESWSDPLEFALKTLRGELPIEDMFTFPSCFNSTFRQNDGCLNLNQSQFDAPINFQNEFGSHSESSSKPNALDPSQATSSSFSALGNHSFKPFTGFNFQPSMELGKKDSQTKFIP